MPVTRATLEALAAPLNRRDFAAFAAAVGHLPAAERNVLAVLGAGHLLGAAPRSRGYLRNPAAFQAWLGEFRRANVEQT